jgi:hypothetical protein
MWGPGKKWVLGFKFSQRMRGVAERKPRSRVLQLIDRDAYDSLSSVKQAKSSEILGGTQTAKLINHQCIVIIYPTSQETCNYEILGAGGGRHGQDVSTCMEKILGPRAVPPRPLVS